MSNAIGGATAGQVLSWTGGFYCRCCFLQDSAAFEQFLLQLWVEKNRNLDGKNLMKSYTQALFDLLHSRHTF